MERITSNQNPLMRHIRKLRASRAYREECGEFVAEGGKLLEEALRWYPKLRTVVLSEGERCPPLPEGVRVVEVPASLLQSLSAMQSPQGMLFTGELPQKAAGAIRAGTLILDRIQDPGNLGTILRTADAFSVPVVLTNDCADPFSDKTIRASMGAVFRTTPAVLELPDLLRSCREHRLPLAAAALTKDAEDLRTVELKNYALIIGSEGQGICAELLAASARRVVIPMQPRCESLNAAVAAAVVMWQLQFGR